MNNILKNITKKTKIFKNIPYNGIGKRLEIEKNGKFTNTGAYCVNTGKYTGRSPNDRYIVENKNLNINWGEVNKGISESKFDYLYNQVIDYYRDKESMYIFIFYFFRKLQNKKFEIIYH
jgi:phosphoenolpyruvate carboxykinase (ATP)